MTNTFLLWQKFCCDKHTFVGIYMLVTTKVNLQQNHVCQNKYLLQQAYFCLNKDMFCYNKHVSKTFVETKVILVAAPANDTGKHQRQQSLVNFRLIYTPLCDQTEHKQHTDIRDFGTERQQLLNSRLYVSQQVSCTLTDQCDAPFVITQHLLTHSTHGQWTQIYTLEKKILHSWRDDVDGIIMTWVILIIQTLKSSKHISYYY